MTLRTIDVGTAETAAFDSKREHDLLARFSGSWKGPVKTWFEPGKPPEESAWSAEGERILGGRFVRVDYRGTAMGQPHAGEMLLAYERDEKRFLLVWIDSFHTGTQAMVCLGELAGESALTFLGSYLAGNERWGWRTTLNASSGGIMIEMTNILPSGEEARAVSATLARA
jgi:hypothetical protein